jgi:hypothetical protein
MSGTQRAADGYNLSGAPALDGRTSAHVVQVLGHGDPDCRTRSRTCCNRRVGFSLAGLGSLGVLGRTSKAAQKRMPGMAVGCYVVCRTVRRAAIFGKRTYGNGLR